RRPLHLAPDAAVWFPELAGRAAILRANGKRRIPVAEALPARSSAAGAPPMPAWSGRAGAAPSRPPAAGRSGRRLRERAPGSTPGAVPISAEDAVARVVANLEPGFDVWHDTIGARVAALACGGAWRLRVGGDPRAAVPVIRELLDRVGR